MNTYDPDDDNDIDDTVPDADDIVPNPSYSLPMSLPTMPTKHGSITHVRVGMAHLGSVISHGQYHLAVTPEGDISEHESKDDAVKQIGVKHGLDFYGA